MAIFTTTIRPRSGSSRPRLTVAVIACREAKGPQMQRRRHPQGAAAAARPCSWLAWSTVDLHGRLC
jgi:hypothetical protein